jgi:ABC-type antimicrobial peptide transport system permease subunit
MYVRTTAEPATTKGAIRQTIQSLDQTLVVDGLKTMDEQIDDNASDNRTLAFLAIGFSALATLLAAVGLYGVLAYSTEQRTREIGVRIALGSPRSQVVMLISREMLIIASIATVVALPATVALARLFSSQLYGVSAFDPVALFAAVFLTALMVLLAAALPARRAAAVEPMQALRTE